MQRFLLLIILSLSFALTPASALEGDYIIVKGQGTNGSSYAGSVVIKRVGQAYTLHWLISKSGEQYSGIGVLKDGMLAVGWAVNNMIGVVNYKVNGDRLEGTWAIAPGGKVGTETLQRKK